EPEALGLLALMVLHDARRATRDRALEEQDRGLWRRDEIDEGLALLRTALAMGRPGPYQLQAAIAALHAEAPSFAETDWVQIAMLYSQLARSAPSPIVELNRAIAFSWVEGPAFGLAMLERLAEDTDLSGYQPYHAARADLLRRAGRSEDAREAYRLALADAPNQAARELLQRRAADL
ncbi:MAG: RNA polymerase subunit sigma-24, partial [Myxococcales bacterium]|nr:RNA polymerase subunit sigma-24 [Myxococcales bacterium]